MPGSGRFLRKSGSQRCKSTPQTRLTTANYELIAALRKRYVLASNTPRGDLSLRMTNQSRALRRQAHGAATALKKRNSRLGLVRRRAAEASSTDYPSFRLSPRLDPNV